MTERRYLDCSAAELFQGGDKPLVSCRCTLEHDCFPFVVAVSHHTAQVISEHCKHHPCPDPVLGISCGELSGYLLVHEHGAPIGVGKRMNAHDCFADLVEAHSQRCSLFFHE